jgi:hypothetical protein
MKHKRMSNNQIYKMRKALFFQTNDVCASPRIWVAAVAVEDEMDQEKKREKQKQGGTNKQLAFSSQLFLQSH